MEFGELLKKTLKENKVKITHLSSLIGMNRMAVYAVFNGEKKLPENIFNLILEKPTKQHYGSYKLIVTVYTFFVAGTFASSLTAAIFTRGTEAFVPFVIYAIGAALFLISDIILSPMYFGDKSKNNPTNFILNHVTYYLGQYIFALTIVLFK